MGSNTITNNVFTNKETAIERFDDFTFMYDSSMPIKKNLVGWLYDFVDGEEYRIWWDPRESAGVIDGYFHVTLTSSILPNRSECSVFLNVEHIAELEKLKVVWEKLR